MIAWTLFYNPMRLQFSSAFWLALPLCVSVAIVYKTVRIEDIRRLPVQVLVLIGYMAAGLIGLGLGLWLLYEYWPF